MKITAMASAFLVSFGLVLLGAASAHDHGHHNTDAENGIQVHQPFVRLMPPMQPNTAAFMRLENASTNDRVLIGAVSDVAEAVELHTHSVVDGMMQMRQVQHIDLPAGDTVVLQPGGLHIMMIGLKAPLQDGQMVEITLQYDDGTEQSIKAPVRHPNVEMQHSMDDHHQH
ncbi:MAG: copper chaperone PCu(A)C [Natronospirillum sp.]